MTPKGNVKAMTQMHRPKISAMIMVRRSRFFSQTPEPAVELYIEEAIMSETPVPFPECIKIRITVKKPESASTTRRAKLSGLTNTPFHRRQQTHIVRMCYANTQ